jgi:hypothetical protein
MGKGEFDIRNVKVIALSVDSVESHKGWINDINETQHVEVNFPIIADENREIAEKIAKDSDYNMSNHLGINTLSVYEYSDEHKNRFFQEDNYFWEGIKINKITSNIFEYKPIKKNTLIRIKD